MKVLPNGIAVIEGDTHISKWVEDSGRIDHDQNMLPLLVPFIRPGSTVIDIGAFIGDHTVFYAGIAGHVHAFEPNVEAFQCLKHNVPSNVTCYLTGASDTHHTAQLAVDPNSGASHLKDATDGVKCFPLDDLVLTDVSFIKLDCEGFEVSALDGLRGTIFNEQPAMLIEINEGALDRQGREPADIYERLMDHGYTWRNIYAEQRCEGPQYDIICIPNDRKWP